MYLPTRVYRASVEGPVKTPGPELGECTRQPAGILGRHLHPAGLARSPSEYIHISSHICAYTYIHCATYVTACVCLYTYRMHIYIYVHIHMSKKADVRI